MIISKTPFRLSLFGGSTDTKLFFQNHGALIIGAALAKYIYILVKYTPPIFNYRTSVQYSKVEQVDDNSLIRHDGCRGVLQKIGITSGIQVANLLDLPARSGLGSSSSYVVGLLHACHKLLNHDNITKSQLANEAIEVERSPKFLAQAGGIQDQIFAAHGGIQIIEINKDGTYKVKPLSITREFIQELNQSMVLFYLGQRNSFEIAKSHETKEAELHKVQIQKLAQEALVAFQNEDIDEIGRLIDETWKQKRQTSPLITTSQVDDLYEITKRHGSLGSRLLGSGGSGFMLCLTHDRHKLIRSVDKNHVEFSFDFEGSKIILS